MSILVINCNHWIGFHVVNALLEKDFKVYGHIDSDRENDMSMFFGRNSSFSFVSLEERKQYDVCIVIGNYNNLDLIRANRKIIVNPKQKKVFEQINNATIIHAKYLFGEWMPMNENGFYDNERFISFNSNEFKENALDIYMFSYALIQWIKSSNLPKYLDIKQGHNKSDVIGIYLRDNGNLDKRVEEVQKHYKLYKNFYN